MEPVHKIHGLVAAASFCWEQDVMSCMNDARMGQMTKETKHHESSEHTVQPALDPPAADSGKKLHCVGTLHAG